MFMQVDYNEKWKYIYLGNIRLFLAATRSKKKWNKINLYSRMCAKS